MKIRTMKPHDLPQIQDLGCQLHQLHQEHRPDIFTQTTPFYLPYLTGFLAEESSIALVCEVNTDVVGFCCATLRPADTCGVVHPRKIVFVEDFFLHPNHRTTGASQALYLHLEEEARARGAQGLEMTVWDFNQRATAFFHRQGFSNQSTTLEKTL